MGHTISLLNMKGGVGKTTLAVNLAWYLSRTKRVLLVDFDPQFNASQYVMDFATYEKHVKENGTIADVLIESPKLRLKSKPESKSLRKTIVTLERTGTKGAFDFVPAELSLAHVVKNPAQMEYKLEKLLKTEREKYDFIFIDCAPTDSVLTTMALNASNFILIPMRPDRYSLLGFANLLETIDQFRKNAVDANSVKELGLVFTQVTNTSDVESSVMNDIRSQAQKLKHHAFQSELAWSNTFLRAVQDQTPIFETRYAREDLKASIRLIAKEMNTRIAEIEEKMEDE